RLPTGEFIEVHQPLGPVDDHGHGELNYAGASVPKRMNQLGTGALRHARGFFRPVIEKPEIAEELAGGGASEEAAAAVERHDKISAELEEVEAERRQLTD